MHQRETDVFPPGPLDWERRRKILSISSAAEDHDALRRILSEPDWTITSAFSCQQAMACLCRDRMGIIFCDSHLPDGNWRDILSQIAGLTELPIVIVTSTVADTTLRAEVSTLGGYRLLPKPFQPEEVERVAGAAWRERSAAGALVPA